MLRTGKFGSYYGNDFNSSSTLTLEQMKVNATYIYSYLSNKGWSINAIAGLLGNMEAESGLNPGRWQSNNVGSGPAYGLVQWDPFSKYTNWCQENSRSDPSEMDNNLDRIIYEVENHLQWIATSSYSLSFKEFTTSNETVSYLAKAFLLNYERPKDQSTTTQNYRSGLASNWYLYLTGTTPTPPTPTINYKKRKYKFILFKRRIYG